MASGPCVRVLLLSLLAFSRRAEALTYRSSYSSVINPYFGMAEDFPHSQNHVSRHSSYAQPRSPLGVYGPENGSPESSYHTAAGLPGGAGASSGRPLNGYLQQESMSSYRSQPHTPSYYQGDTDGVLQSKDAMWDLAPSQKRNWIDAGIVSSYPIEMRSVPQQPSIEHQTQPHDEQEQFSDESSMFQSRPQPRPLPQQPRYEASKLHAQAQPQPFPQQPRYEASKLHAQPRPLPQQPRYEAAQPRPLPQQPRYEASKPHAQVQPEREQFGDESSKFQPRPLPQQPRYEASKPHAQVQPEREQLGDEPSKFQPRPFPQQPHYDASKLQGSEANSPSGGVLQTKSGMWDLADPRSFRLIPVSLRNLYRWPQQQAPIYNRY